MGPTAHRLVTLKVKDVMSRDVASLSPEQTLAEVAVLFTDNGVTGAPVLDDSGKCVGVLSSVDYVRKDGAKKESGSGHVGERGIRERVSEVMSTAVYAVRPEQTMLDAARIMCVKHIHRLPVVDDQNHLVGLIASMDVVAALVNAIDEREAAAK